MIRRQTLSLWIALTVGLLLIGSAAWGDVAPAKQRILVLPFVVLNGTPDQAWMGKAIQDNTVAELGRSPYLMPVAHAGARPDADAAVAARLGRAASTPFALYGSAQFVGENVRITAQLINSHSSDVVGSAVSTGPISELLRLEDEVVAQLRPIAISPPVAGAADAVTPVTPVTPQPAQAPAPRVVVVIVNNTQQPVISDVPDLSLASQTPQYASTPYFGYPSYSSFGYGNYPYYPPSYYPSYGYGYGYGYPYYGGRFYSPGFALIRSTGPQYGPLTPGSTMAPGVVNLSALDTVNQGPKLNLAPMPMPKPHNRR